MRAARDYRAIPIRDSAWLALTQVEQARDLIDLGTGEQDGFDRAATRSPASQVGLARLALVEVADLG